MNRPDSPASETAPSTAAPRDPREEVPPPSAQAPTEESTGELPPRNGATGVQTPRIDPELMGPEPPSPYDTPTPAAQENEGLLDTPPATTPPANSGDDDLLSRRGRSVLNNPRLLHGGQRPQVIWRSARKQSPRVPLVQLVQHHDRRASRRLQLPRRPQLPLGVSDHSRSTKDH